MVERGIDSHILRSLMKQGKAELGYNLSSVKQKNDTRPGIFSSLPCQQKSKVQGHDERITRSRGFATPPLLFLLWHTARVWNEDLVSTTIMVNCCWKMWKVTTLMSHRTLWTIDIKYFVCSMVLYLINSFVIRLFDLSHLTATDRLLCLFPYMEYLPRQDLQLLLCESFFCSSSNWPHLFLSPNLTGPLTEHYRETVWRK